MESNSNLDFQLLTLQTGTCSCFTSVTCDLPFTGEMMSDDLQIIITVQCVRWGVLELNWDQANFRGQGGHFQLECGALICWNKQWWGRGIFVNLLTIDRWKLDRNKVLKAILCIGRLLVITHNQSLTKYHWMMLNHTKITQTCHISRSYYGLRFNAEPLWMITYCSTSRVILCKCCFMLLSKYTSHSMLSSNQDYKWCRWRPSEPHASYPK